MHDVRSVGALLPTNCSMYKNAMPSHLNYTVEHVRFYQDVLITNSTLNKYIF